MSHEIGIQVAKRLVRSGLKSAKIRERIEKVVKERKVELRGKGVGEGEVELLVGSEARTQLLNEAFAELRYRSLLMVMRNEMPLLPMQRSDTDLEYPAIAKVPIDPKPGSPMKQITFSPPPLKPSPSPSRSMPSPVPTLSDPVGKGPPTSRQEGLHVNRVGRLGRLYSWWNRTHTNALENSEGRKGMTLLQETSRGGIGNMTDADMLRASSLTPLEVRYLVAKRIRKVTELIRTEGVLEQPHEALKLARESLVMMQCTHGAGHPLLLPVLNVYAFACLHVKHLEQCQLAVKILDNMFEKLENEHAESVVYPMDPLCYSPQREKAILLSVVMQLSYHNGQFKDAVDFANKALEVFEEVGDDETIASAKDSVSLMLAVSLTMLGRSEEAEVQFKRSLVDLVDRHSQNSPAIVPNLQLMSAYAMNMKNYDEAQTLAATAYKNLHQNLGQHHPRTLSGMKQVAEMCLLTKQYKTAAKWLLVLNRMYIEYLTRFGAALSPVEHANSLHLLSLSFLGLHKPEEALQVSTHSLRLYERTISGQELLALREPLLTWCTAFRMCGCHAQKEGARHVITVLHRFLDLMQGPHNLPPPSPSDLWYCLHHLSYYHLWAGNYAKSACAVHALQQLEPRPAYADIRPWLDDVERVQRAQHMAGWPDHSNSFIYALCLCLAADGCAYLYTYLSSPPDRMEEVSEQ
eukprot:TRINITY_DN3976_c2_g1_i1.p1 TRINITY_DN3976_c2_g1~~TRINITY_DN3976_c2_g1_i1.p1  ORF type:complete len:690 (+),score=171.31 TRINITY_DN3976_c2_g1_i1:76-2145(+)